MAHRQKIFLTSLGFIVVVLGLDLQEANVGLDWDDLIFFVEEKNNKPNQALNAWHFQQWMG